MRFDRSRAFTYERQRLGRAAPDAPAALREIVGVYSSHPSAPLSLRARAREFNFAAVDGMRLPAMRGSIHLLPRSTAHLAFRALEPSPALEASRMRYFKVTPERYAELRSRTLAVAADGRARTAAELKAEAGGGDEFRYVIAALAREGALVRVGAKGLRSNALRYVRPDPPIPSVDRGEALAWLAGEYLRAYGPARPADFAWWTGAPAKDAAAALAAHPVVEVEGGMLLRAEDEAAFERPPAPRGIDVLPKWDMLTMGYPKDGRGRFAHEDVVGRCYDFRGDGLPLILLDGEAIAAWAMRSAGKRMEVEVDWFERPGVRARAAIDRELEELARLLA